MNNTTILWEDTDLIEPWKKSESKPIFVQNDGINETNNVFVKNECNDTGNKCIWMRICPTCRSNIFYGTKGHFKRAEIKNSECKSCTVKKQIKSKNCVGNKYGKLKIVSQYKDCADNKTYADAVCDCGNSIVHRLLTDFKRGKTYGCAKCQYLFNLGKVPPNKLSEGESSFHEICRSYENGAKARHLVFELSKDDMRILFRGNCFYCGKEPQQCRKRRIGSNGEFRYNGIDRKDNTLGYMSSNCVSCCGHCNFAKNKTSFSDFIRWIRTVNENTKNINCD